MNKDAYLRYCIIDNCLHNSLRGWTIEELMEKIDEGLAERYPDRKGISRQQLYLDLREMDSYEYWNIELKKTSTRPVLYSYADPSRSIHDTGLPPHFRQNLQAACDLLHSFKGLPQLEWLSDSITQMEIFSQDTSGELIEFECNNEQRGIEFLEPILNAVRSKEVLVIKYRPYGKQPYHNRLRPYYLKQYNKRWWVFGEDVNRNDGIHVLCIDRIIKIYQTNEHFESPSIDWKQYFNEIIGVTNKVDQKCQKVRFLAYGQGRFHIRNTPLHLSQKCKFVNDNTYEFTLFVKPNYELKKTLMQYAHEIKILEPKELVEGHKEWLKQALNNYTPTTSKPD